MIYALATTSALMFALASALQHRSAQRADHAKAMRISLLFSLALDPIWIIGILADAVALLFQFAALIKGSVLVVQPILAVGLVFSLLFSAILNKKWLSRSEWLLSIVTAVSLFGFLKVGVPSRLTDVSTLSSWLVVGALTLVITIVMGVVAMKLGGLKRVVLLSVSAGILHGVTVSLSKIVSQDFAAKGILHLAVDPYVWLLIVLGAADLLVIQSAFQAGPLKVSLPIISVVEPIVALGVSLLVLHERLSASGAGIAVAIVSLCVMLGAVWALARVSAEHGEL